MGAGRGSTRRTRATAAPEPQLFGYKKNPYILKDKTLTTKEQLLPRENGTEIVTLVQSVDVPVISDGGGVFQAPVEFLYKEKLSEILPHFLSSASSSQWLIMQISGETSIARDNLVIAKREFAEAVALISNSDKNISSFEYSHGEKLYCLRGVEDNGRESVLIVKEESLKAWDIEKVEKEGAHWERGWATDFVHTAFEMEDAKDLVFMLDMMDVHERDYAEFCRRMERLQGGRNALRYRDELKPLSF